MLSGANPLTGLIEGSKMGRSIADTIMNHYMSGLQSRIMRQNMNNTQRLAPYLLEAQRLNNAKAQQEYQQASLMNPLLLQRQKIFNKYLPHELLALYQQRIANASKAVAPKLGYVGGIPAYMIGTDPSTAVSKSYYENPKTHDKALEYMNRNQQVTGVNRGASIVGADATGRSSESTPEAIPQEAPVYPSELGQPSTESSVNSTGAESPLVSAGNTFNDVDTPYNPAYNPKTYAQDSASRATLLIAKATTPLGGKLGGFSAGTFLRSAKELTSAYLADQHARVIRNFAKPYFGVGLNKIIETGKLNADIQKYKNMINKGEQNTLEGIRLRNRLANVLAARQMLPLFLDQLNTSAGGSKTRYNMSALKKSVEQFLPYFDKIFISDPEILNRANIIFNQIHRDTNMQRDQMLAIRLDIPYIREVQQEYADRVKNMINHILESSKNKRILQTKIQQLKNMSIGFQYDALQKFLDTHPKIKKDYENG